MHKSPLPLLLICLTASLVFINKRPYVDDVIYMLKSGGWHNISIDAPVVKEAMRDYKEVSPDIEQHELIKSEVQVVAGINIRLCTTLNNVQFIHTMHRTLGSNDKFILMRVHQQNKL